MAYGSILSKFKRVTLSTADNKQYVMKMNFINRIGLKIIGIPHLGFRHRARIIFKLVQQLSVNEKSLILDAGCGYGVYSFMLAEKKLCVDSLDIEDERINAIKDRIKEYQPYSKFITPQQGSLTQIPFRDSTFDLIICSEVIEHMEEDELAVKELSRVLVPGGHLILTTPTTSKQNRKVFKSFGHVRPGYTDEDYYKFAEKNNLKVEKLIHYEFMIGSSMFVFQQMMKSNILLGLSFYPLYVLSLVDLILRLGEPNGVVCLFQKNE